MRQQITAATGQLAHRGHCGGALVPGQVPPPGMALRLAVQLGDTDTVSWRSLIEHAF